MISSPPTTLVACLIVVVPLVLIPIWLWFRNRKSGRSTLPTPQQAAWQHTSPAFDPDEEEWESMAPYPEHAIQARHEGRLAGQSGPATSSFHDARGPIPADTPHPAQDLRDAWESLQEAFELEAQPAASSPQPSRSPPAAPSPQVRCPRCLSTRIDTRNLARKAGSTIGSVAGATGGIAAALAGAETGAVVGSIAGPLGTVFGGLAGAAIAGLVGSAAGCAAGSAVGGAIDDNVLDNHLCLACGHAFSVSQD